MNPDLYYLVFGESLLNDGVAIVIYDMMLVFVGMESGGHPVTVGQVGDCRDEDTASSSSGPPNCLLLILKSS